MEPPPWSVPTDPSSASIGQEGSHAVHLAPDAPTSTPAACATQKIMVQVLVRNTSDPRKVSTPLDADGLEGVLRKFGIFDDWSDRKSVV